MQRLRKESQAGQAGWTLGLVDPALRPKLFSGPLGVMLRVAYAASGKEVLSLEAVAVAERCPIVGELKRYLCHLTGASRFQQRIVSQGEVVELRDDVALQAPVELQLTILSHRPPDSWCDYDFLEACRRGAYEFIEQMLQDLQNPNCRTYAHTACALIYAASADHPAVVGVLLEAMADPEALDKNRCTALHVAAQKGHAECAWRLLEHGALLGVVNGFGATPWRIAVMKGRPEVARVLLQAQADMEEVDEQGRRPLHLAVQKGHLELSKLLLELRAELQAVDKQLRCPLHYAAVCSVDVEAMVGLLMKARGDIAAADSRRWTALHMAHSSRAVRALLHSRASVHAADVDGFTPLHTALHPGAVGQILDALADPRAADRQGRTALHHAAERSCPEVVGRLLEARGCLEAPDLRGNTALHLAMEQGVEPMVHDLVLRGASKHARNGEGVSPLHLAAGKPQLLRLLEAKRRKGRLESRGEEEGGDHGTVGARGAPQSLTVRPGVPPVAAYPRGAADVRLDRRVSGLQLRFLA